MTSSQIAPVDKIWMFVSRLMEYSVDSCSDLQLSILLNDALDLQQIPIRLVSHLITPQSINRPNASGTRPIYKAIQTRNWELVHLFLAHKVDVNCINLDGETPLHECLRYNVPLSVLEHFIKPETVNVLNKDGDSPLHLAARSQQCEIVESLIKAGGDINIANKKGIIPLQEVLTHENIQYPIVKLLVSEQNVNTVDPDRCTPLHRLLMTQNWDLVSYVLTLGADVNVRTVQTVQDEKQCTCKWSTLHMALEYDAPNDLIGNINMGGNEFDDEGNLNEDEKCRYCTVTPLHLAVKKSKWDIADRLISFGADVDLIDYDGGTPLIDVIENETCPIELFKKLISKANINKKGGYCGETALTTAAQLSESWHYIPILVDHGADINENMNENYGTPLLRLLCCEEVPEMSIFKLLLSSENVNAWQEFFEPTSCKLKQVFMNGWWQFIPVLVQYGANVEGVLKSRKKEKTKVASLLDISTHTVRGLMIELSDEYFDCLGLPYELLPQLKLRHLADQVVELGESMLTRASREKFAESVTW